MRTHQAECHTKTIEPLDFVDLTDEVQGVIDESGIEDGQVTVFTPQTECVIVVNERESGLLSDVRRALDRLHSGGASKGRAMIGSCSVVLPAEAGKLRLGTWQRVLLVELEEGAERSVVVQIVGE
jgi:secondary thiamine-phosphate synthase enzyme